jgi:hypothetical protein
MIQSSRCERLFLIVKLQVVLKMLNRRSGRQELGDLVNTVRNTNATIGNVPQFDLHQSPKSNVPSPLISYLSSNDLMAPVKSFLNPIL